MNDILGKLADKYSSHTSSSHDTHFVLVDGDVSGMAGGQQAAVGQGDAPQENIPLADIPPADAPQANPHEKGLPQTWRDSEAVVALSEFMAAHKRDGFFLHQTREGQPVIHMEPGVSPSDPGRWELSGIAMDLAQAAFDDLVHLIAIKALTLSPAKEYGARAARGLDKQVQLICGGSISSGITAVAKEHDIEVVGAALRHEMSTSRREPLVNAIKAREKVLRG